MNGGLQCFGDIVGGGVIEELILFVPQHDLREDKALVEGFIPEIFDDIPAADKAGDIDAAAEGDIGHAVDGKLPVGEFILCGFQKLPQEGGGGFAGGKGEVTFLLIAVFHGKGGGEFIPQKGGGAHAVAQLVKVLVIAVIRQGQPGDEVELIGAEGDAAAVAAQHLFPEFIGDADAVSGFLGGHHPQGVQPLPMAGEPDGY